MQQMKGNWTDNGTEVEWEQN